jgi:hypothetical protein
MATARLPCSRLIAFVRVKPRVKHGWDSKWDSMPHAQAKPKAMNPTPPGWVRPPVLHTTLVVVKQQQDENRHDA